MHNAIYRLAKFSNKRLTVIISLAESEGRESYSTVGESVNVPAERNEGGTCGKFPPGASMASNRGCKSNLTSSDRSIKGSTCNLSSFSPACFPLFLPSCCVIVLYVFASVQVIPSSWLTQGAKLTGLCVES